MLHESDKRKRIFQIVKHNVFKNTTLKRKINLAFRFSTASLRMLPNFLIIGAQKCGTTSLYNYLIQHPDILPAFQKEPNFFSFYFDKGKLYYKSYFPTFLHKIKKPHLITGEASPSYLFYPHVPARVAKHIPNIKLIVMLRNPVDRAYSQYNMNIKANIETMSFEDAIKNETNRLFHHTDKYTQKEINNYNFRWYSYLLRSVYVDQLINWMKYFRRNQFLILRTEDFDKNPQDLVNQVFSFLDLPNFQIKNLKRFLKQNYKQEMNSITRKYLLEYFKPYNEKLSKFLDMSFEWNK